MNILALEGGSGRIRSFRLWTWLSQAARIEILTGEVQPHQEVSANPIGDGRFIHETGMAASLVALVEPVLVDMGFRLVRLSIAGRDAQTVQIMAERPDGTITIDECEQISRQVSAVFDVHDVIAAAYRLEISSPGIDRPLVRMQDFEDWAGYEAKIELSQPVDGRKRFRGKIEGFEGDEVRIECDLDQIGRTVLGFPAGLISEARLVLTDELVREALSRAKQQGKLGVGDGSEPDGFEVEDK
jgi:ribosome maturation factor RimP